MRDNIKKTRWVKADKLRANLNEVECKYLVLGPIFRPNISNAFAARPASDLALVALRDASLPHSISDHQRLL